MKKIYKSSKVNFEDVKKKTMSPSFKKWIASFLITGSTLLVGTPSSSYAYTQLEIQEHQSRLDEVPNYVKHYRDKTIKDVEVLKNDILKNESFRKKLLEKYNLSEDQLLSDLDEKINLFNSIADDMLDYNKKLKLDSNSIKDKTGINMMSVGQDPQTKKVKVVIALDHIGQLTADQLTNLEKNYDISSVKVHRYYHISDNNEIASSQFTYDIKTYKKLLVKMDELLGNIKSNTDLNNLDKVLLTIKRIKSNISYDWAAFYGNDLQYQERVINTSRNLVGPLLHGKTVCAGYSDLFKQSMSYLGIPAREIIGNHSDLSTLGSIANHAWNQVQIDGNWYNLDLTNMSQLSKNSNFAYVLTSDSDFNPTRENKNIKLYTPFFGNHQECNKSISKNQLRASFDKLQKFDNCTKTSIFLTTLNKLKNPFQNKRKVLALNAGSKLESVEQQNNFRKQTLESGKYRIDIEQYSKNLSYKKNVHDNEHFRNKDDLER